MLAYIIRRTLYCIPIMFGVALIVFTLFNVVGGDPVLLMLGKHATPERIADLRHQLGLDQPKWKQFVDYLGQIATFDYGLSYATKETITEKIMRGVGPSFLLAGTGFTITLIMAMAIALFVAFFRGTWIDKVISILCVAGMSISSLAIILFSQYFFAYKWGAFPISGYESGFPGNMASIALPAIIWVLLSLGVDVRYYRTAILDEVAQDYVRTARAKGLTERVIYFKHILKNSMIPVITHVVIEMPFLILGSLLLESFFQIPGIGSLTIDAFNNQDYPVMKAMTTVISLMVIFGTLISDILYTVVDPRVKLK